MWERGWAFLARAGTVIFAVTIVVWALAYYPRPTSKLRPRLPAQRAAIQNDAAALAEFDKPENFDRSRSEPASAIQLLGPCGPVRRAGRSPAGLGLADRLCGDCLVPGSRSRDGRAGRDLQSGPESRRGQPKKTRTVSHVAATGRPVGRHGRAGVQFTRGAVDHGVFRPVCQCAATLAVIRRETNSWRWPVFTFAYMTMLAYVGALLTYQIGIRIIS